MKNAKLAIIGIATVAMTACTGERREPKDGIDIKNINITQGVAFDYRIISDVYGNPEVVDPTANAIAYQSTYYYYDWYLFTENKPQYSERWYLVLTPSDADKFYYGEKIKITRRAQNGNYVYMPNVKTVSDIRKNADIDIKKNNK